MAFARDKSEIKETPIRTTPCSRFFSCSQPQSVFPGVRHMPGRHTMQFFKSDGTGFSRILEKADDFNEDYVSFDALNSLFLYTRDGEFVGDLLNNSKVREGDTLQPIMVGPDALTAQPFPSSGWHAQRPHYNMALGKGVVKNYIPGIRQIAEKYIKAIDEKPVQNVGELRQLASYYMVDAISFVLFGIEDLKEKDKVVKALHEIPSFLTNGKNLVVGWIEDKASKIYEKYTPQVIQDGVKECQNLVSKAYRNVLPQVVQDYANTAANYLKPELNQKREEAHALIEQILKVHQQEIEANENSIFMQLLKKKGYKYNSAECQKIAMFLYGAGFETTSANLFFSLLTAGARPKLFGQLVDEIKKHWPNFEGELTEDKINKMEKLTAFFEENLKWFSPFTLGKFALAEDYQHKTLGILKKGTIICYDLTRLLQIKNGVYGPEADEFKLRMEEKGDKAAMDHNTRFFFGGNSMRKCPGQHSAILEVKIFFCYLAKAIAEVKLDEKLANVHPYLPLKKVFSLCLQDKDSKGTPISEYKFTLTTEASRLCEEQKVNRSFKMG